jgi:uncharacterized membrane protein YqjE
MLEGLSAALASAHSALTHFFDLMELEARRAGHALMWMFASAMAAFICIAAAWLGLMAVLVMWAVSLGAPLIAALLAIAVINCIVAAVLIYLFVSLARDLLFPTTRRQLADTLLINKVATP